MSTTTQVDISRSRRTRSGTMTSLQRPIIENKHSLKMEDKWSGGSSGERSESGWKPPKKLVTIHDIDTVATALDMLSKIPAFYISRKKASPCVEYMQEQGVNQGFYCTFQFDNSFTSEQFKKCYMAFILGIMGYHQPIANIYKSIYCIEVRKNGRFKDFRIWSDNGLSIGQIIISMSNYFASIGNMEQLYVQEIADVFDAYKTCIEEVKPTYDDISGILIDASFGEKNHELTLKCWEDTFIPVIDTLKLIKLSLKSF